MKGHTEKLSGILICNTVYFCDVALVYNCVIKLRTIIFKISMKRLSILDKHFDASQVTEKKQSLSVIDNRSGKNLF
jgi:hypothetical protein